MARKKQETQEKKTLTRAQKTEATKVLIKELLAIKPMRHNELLEEVAKNYVSRYEGEDTENVNDVKGRIGSVLDIMKKESDVMYDGGMYALKARLPMPRAVEEKVAEEKTDAPAPAKKAVKGKAKTTAVEAKETVEEKKEEETKAEIPAPKKRGRAKKAETPVEETPKAVEAVKEEPVKEVVPAEKQEEAPAQKKRGRKPKEKAVEEKVEEKSASKTRKKVEKPAPKKADDGEESVPVEEKKVEAPAPVVEEKSTVEEKVEAPIVEKQEEPKKEESLPTGLVVKPKAELAQKNVVMDMSFLFGDKAVKPRQKPQTPPAKASVSENKSMGEKKELVQEKQAPMSATNGEKVAAVPAITEPKTEEKPAVKAVPAVVKSTPAVKAEKPQPRMTRGSVKPKQTDKPQTADEKLKESYLKRMRSLGGDYFEYYSVYLLERYSMKNGRRLEGMRISGGDHDGGIDGEIELTDRFGFKETIYIQSKNWDPEKGKEINWVVGETLLQQFIGACACRQAKDGKQHTRGIFVTTSRFTPDAKKILDDMSERIIGYDGDDLYEAAKECEFGVIKKNGEWCLDEKLLSGTKAFFQML